MQKFNARLADHIFQLHRDLVNKTYRHGPYRGFYIRDPKVRHIHKATVRDRVLHHAVFRVLSPIFEPASIPTSFSCRVGKGTHKGFKWLVKTARKVSRNYTSSCFVLKCDVKKFFDSVDHAVLLAILERKIKDADILWLLREIIRSYSAVPRERERERVQSGAGKDCRLATSPASSLPMCI